MSSGPTDKGGGGYSRISTSEGARKEGKIPFQAAPNFCLNHLKSNAVCEPKN